MEPINIGASIAIIAGAAAMAAILAGIVYAIVQVLRSPDLSDLAKTIWIIALIVTPVVGTIVWFATRDREPLADARGRR